MAIPLVTQLFSSFGGTQESVSQFLLPDIFSSGGSKNVYVNKLGEVKSIYGYKHDGLTTVTPGTSYAVRSMFPYRSSTAGVFSRVTLAVSISEDPLINIGELQYSTDGLNFYSAESTLVSPASPGSAYVGKVPDFAQFGNDVYMAVGEVTPLKSSNGTSWAYVNPTQSLTPFVTESTTDGVLKGSFKYKLVAIKTDGTRIGGSDETSPVQVSNKRINVSWLADPDTSVGGYEIYRTTGTGVVYYFLYYSDGRETPVAYEDNVSDLTLLEGRTLEEHGDPPPATYFVEPHKQRMWWLRSDAQPRRAYYSDAGRADSVYPSNFIDVSDEDSMGDVITGAFGNFEDQLIITTERAVWVISGNGQILGNISDWTRAKSNAQTGSLAGKTIVKLPVGAKYTDTFGAVQVTEAATLAYMTPLRDIRLFDGKSDKVISTPVKDSLSYLNYAKRSKCFACHDTKRGHVIWMYPHDIASEPSRAVVWDYKWGIWYQWYDLPFASMIELDTASDATILYAGTNDTGTYEHNYEFFVGENFQNTPIVSWWMTKTLYGTTDKGVLLPSNLKRWRWADLFFSLSGSAVFNLEWYKAEAEDDEVLVTGNTKSQIVLPSWYITTSTGDGIDTGDEIPADVGDIYLHSSRGVARVLLKNSSSKDFFSDTGVRLKFTNNSGGSWTINGLNLTYQIMPGLQRRMQ